MAAFSRAFDTAGLESWDRDNPTNVVRSLFDRWSLPGQPSTAATPLRIGVRNGYVNFYVDGQSVAKVISGRAGPSVSVHRAYVEGRARAFAGKTVVRGGANYASFGPQSLVQEPVCHQIETWIATARTYAGAEKRFVDELIGANAGAIDLEMGLPAEASPSRPSIAAPRMDLVVAQSTVDNPPQIAFWEAKCAGNGELRAIAAYVESHGGAYQSGPKVIHQLRKYQQWISSDARLAEVEQAYKSTANILISLYDIFRRNDETESACVKVWRALAVARELNVISRPGLAVGNYSLSMDGQLRRREPERIAGSFAQHRSKLESHNITVHEIGIEDSQFVLPNLTDDNQQKRYI